jgi:hypothetical protein
MEDSNGILSIIRVFPQLVRHVPDVFASTI